MYAHHPSYYRYISLNFEICVFPLYESQNLNLSKDDKYNREQKCSPLNGGAQKYSLLLRH